MFRMPEIVENSFLKIGEYYVWTWGPLHFENHIVALIRYIEKNGIPQKTKKYGLIKQEPDTLKQYGSYLEHISPYAIILGRFNKSDISKYFCPLNRYRESGEDRQMIIIKKLLENEIGLSPRFLGIGSSKLLGINTSSSDIDINVYSLDQSYIAYDYLKNWHSKYMASYMSSTSFNRFIELLRSRRAKSAYCRVPLSMHYEGVKIDFHFFPEVNTIQIISARDFEYQNKVTIRMKIMDTNKSLFFPGVISGIQLPSGKKLDVVYTDKLIMFLREGDDVLLTGRFVEYKGSSPFRFRNTELDYYFAASKLETLA